MSTTIPALSSVTDILDTDLVMVTHSNGESFKIAGSEINKRNQAVIADSTTLTGAPLKTGNIVRVYFTADITGSNTSTGLTLNYNGVNKSVKVPKNGTLANFVASDLGGSPTVYKYLQAHTTLELLYDGTQFIIIGNPVVLSSADYTIYADGNVYDKNSSDIILSLASGVTLSYSIRIKNGIVFFTINELNLANDINHGTIFISNLPKPLTQFRFSILKSGGTKSEILTVTMGGNIFMPHAYDATLPAGTYYPEGTITYATR